MTDLRGEHLREVFREEALQAPLAASVTAGVLREVQRHRRRRGIVLSIAGASLTAVTAAVVSLTPVLGGTGSTQESVRHGALPGSATADCDAAESVNDIAARAIAFDGTVTAIGGSGVSAGQVPVTFTVHEWFKGGKGADVTVSMQAPLEAGEYSGEAGPSYGVGTRLLVSGEPLGASGRAALLAWGCGYTRYSDVATRESWRTVVGHG